MFPSGYSTGALSLGDFRSALIKLRGSSADAVELSALRVGELAPLIEVLSSLDLSGFRYISVHAPSKFSADEEPGIVKLLKHATKLQYSVIIHPDTIHNVELWASLGAWLCIENMDRRKHVGRSADELAIFFSKLPDAGLCFDIAHARQFDSTMTEAFRILQQFASRIRQVHVSEVSTLSKHARLSIASIADFRQVAAMIPSDAAIISEAPVSSDELESELTLTRSVFESLVGPTATTSRYWR